MKLTHKECNRIKKLMYSTLPSFQELDKRLNIEFIETEECESINYCNKDILPSNIVVMHKRKIEKKEKRKLKKVKSQFPPAQKSESADYWEEELLIGAFLAQKFGK